MKNLKWVAAGAKISKEGLISAERMDFQTVSVVTHACKNGQLVEGKIGYIGKAQPSTWVCWQLFAWAGACEKTAPVATTISGTITGSVQPLTEVGRLHLYALFSSVGGGSGGDNPNETDKDRRHTLIAVAVLEQVGKRTAILRAMCVNPLKQGQGYGSIAVKLLMQSKVLRSWFLLVPSRHGRGFWERLGGNSVSSTDDAASDDCERLALEALFELKGENKHATVLSLG